MVTVNGGTGGNGGTGNIGSIGSTGGNGGNGGDGISGGLTVNGGMVTVNGGTGGIKGKRGKSGISGRGLGSEISVTSSVATAIIQESYDKSTWSNLESGSSSELRYIRAGVPVALQLYDGESNTETIADNNGRFANVTLQGRTLFKDGKWNTLCLPFDVSTTTGPLSGDNVEAMVLHSSDSGLSGTTLTLNFDTATSIPAGTPFIIRWGTPDSHPDTDLTDPVFSDVTINNTTNDVDFTGGAFKGTYKKITYTTENQSILLLGDKDNLYYPQPTGGSNPSIGAFRAYFELNSSASARAFVLNFGEGETTGILSTTNLTNDTNSDAWYDLSGRRLSSKPTQSGLYLNNGRKVVIK
jgi:hypothetical protein